MHQPTPHEAAALFQKGIDQFNRREFFESHESWELVWLPASEPDKTFLQGIIQVAAALHHYRRQNRSGAQSLMTRGLAKIEQFPASYRGLHLEDLRRTARAWRAFLDSSHATEPPLPTITLTTPQR